MRSERWSHTSNTFYEKAVKTYVRSTFGTAIFHFTLLLTPSLYTVHTRQDVRICSGACKSHQTPFVIWSPKPASVRWDSWKSLSSAIRSDYSKMSLYLKPRRRSHGTVWSCCETESSHSQQGSESGCPSPAPRVKRRTKGHFSAVTSNTWELSLFRFISAVSLLQQSPCELLFAAWAASCFHESISV